MTLENGASVNSPALPAPCAECGYDDCAGDCTRRVTAQGPCAFCGDPTEPGESLCRTCQREEEA